jgi:hypothetical protein
MSANASSFNEISGSVNLSFSELMNDKIIVTNLAALKKKYGSAGVSKIRAAIRALIAADKARGLQTRLLALDHKTDMKKVKGTAVTNPTNARQNKFAIDAVFTAIRPDYLLILGAIDVVPHQNLNNPVFGSDDPDTFAYGDLAYACEQSYNQQADKFIGPTRVVGRLPDITNAKDPSYLIGLINTAAKWKARTREDYSDYFAISADEWHKSTALSVQRLFGSSKNLKLCPPSGPKWTAALLNRRIHFINCHGGQTDPQFYGQKGNNYPIAHEASWIDGKINEGTVAAMECCYGGELYDPLLLSNRQVGICNTYLAGKAYGYFGSSTIAYGPAEGNGSADLLCQYFLRRVLAGASLGRAALEARQEFAQAGPDLDPIDVKTLAQFSLFGDPSITPIAAPAPHMAVTREKTTAARFAAAPIARAERRRQLLTKGLTISNTQPVARRATRTSIGARLSKILRRLAAKANIAKPKMLSFRIESAGRPTVGAQMQKTFAAAHLQLPKATAYHVAIGRSKRTSDAPVVQITAVIAKEFDGKIVSYRELHSR